MQIIFINEMVILWENENSSIRNTIHNSINNIKFWVLYTEPSFCRRRFRWGSHFNSVRSFVTLTFYNGQNHLHSAECLLMLINIIHKGSLSDSNSATYPMGLLYLISCFHLFWENILSVMYADWGSPHLSLVVCYIFPLLIHLLCKTWFYKGSNRNWKSM